MSTTKGVEFPIYKPPTHGILSKLPSSWVPFAELTRLHKPAGTLHAYFPYLLGILFSDCLTQPSFATSWRQLLTVKLILYFLVFLLHCVGCTWNDILDRELDRHVLRCSVRPLARRAISVRAACIFTVAQYAFIFLVVRFACPQVSLYLIPVIITGTIYPYTKRFTNWAQGFLGITNALGTLVGCAAAGLDPLTLGSSRSGMALFCIATSYCVWTLIYDTIYAFQDVQYDKAAGIKTFTLAYEGYTKPVFGLLAVIQTGFLVAAAGLMDATWALACGIFCAAILLAIMVARVDLESPDSCRWWFQNGGLLFGVILSLALQAECSSRYFGWPIQ